MSHDLERYENIPPGEAHDIQRVVELTKDIVQLNGQHVLRGQHAKATGAVHARLQIANHVPEHARHGIFSRQGHEYRALVRFSNGIGRIQSDAVKDARGMAIKVLDVEGARIPGDESSSQDFVMINFATFPFRNVRQYAHFTALRRRLMGLFGAAGNSLAGLLFFIPWHLGQFLRVARHLKRFTSNTLTEQYWSMSAYGLGDHPIKFTAVPDVRNRQFVPETPIAPGENALSEMLAAQLKQQEARFELQVQSFQDETSTPVEDPTVLWSTDVAPPFTVATLIIDRCDLTTCNAQHLRETVEQLSFSPWNCLAAHRPLGGMNRVRQAVYRMNMELRNRKAPFAALIESEGEFIAAARATAADLPQGDATADNAARGDTAPGKAASEKAAQGNGDKTKVSYSASLGSNASDGAEPWVSFNRDDRVGLAFSGGGIRSATFNLGLLQGLNDLKLLPGFDYLATVSGGGYIGAWWSAWRSRRDTPAGRHFPSVVENRSVRVTTAEPYEVRHLRRFSNFLVPRFGLLELEFWNGVMAVLSGLIPALAVTSGMVALTVWVWMILAWCLLGHGVCCSAITLTVISVVVFAVGECWWRCSNKQATETRASLATYGLFSGVAVVAIVGLRVLLHAYDAWLPPLPTAESPVAFFQSFSLRQPEKILELFLPAVIFAIVIVGLIFLRFVRVVAESSRGRTHFADSALRRVLGRLAFVVLVWSISAAVWWLAATIRDSAELILATGGIGGLAASLFAWLRTWIVRAMQPGRQVGFAKKLRALLPQVLAYVALFSAITLICLVVQVSFESPVLVALSYALPIVVVVCAWLWFDPVNCGLHAFYRDRLSRAYLGASNRAIENQVNEQLTEVHPNDDVLLSTIGAADNNRLPLHLVCCAANELDADPLSNFSRGARSAVLSPLGLSIGDCWSRDSHLSLGSAITASAAAFNSNMGSVSKQLGAAVTFLMCALNLRLGLWVARPGMREAFSWLKGWPYFFEMFGATSRSKVHLSDGAHFENLALYELVRRHCRYIVVSDVSADPDVAFDDLGNAVRRIRDDFGVDIEIDIDPLKPDADGLSRQHMVVGTIHYDHATSDGHLDKGILLYFKPGLTGDEPVDVRQYRSRNEDFPNETTVDQFYDEAQWEAYRRLGQHAAHAALGFVEEIRGADRPALTSNDVFVGARWKWYPTPPELPENMPALTSRFIAFEAELRAAAPPRMVQEIYPEVAGQFPTDPWPGDSMTKAIHFLIQMLQLMEDTYLVCQLEEHWNHPLNSGWMNGFLRWANAPVFQSWWPVLKGMYSDGFRDFVQGRLNVQDKADVHALGPFDDWTLVPPGLAKSYAQHGELPHGPASYWTGSYQLATADGTALHPVQVGLLKVFVTDATSETDATWEWTFDDLFVLPQLGATGTATSFLKEMLKTIRSLPVDKPKFLKVVNQASPAGRHVRTAAAAPAMSGTTGGVFTAAQRAEWNDQVSLYKRLGFLEQRNGSLRLKI